MIICTSSNLLHQSTSTAWNPSSPHILTKCLSTPSSSVSNKVFGPLWSQRTCHAPPLSITPLVLYRTLLMSFLSMNRGTTRSNKATFVLLLGSTSFLGWLPYQSALSQSHTLTNYSWWLTSPLEILHPTVLYPNKALRFPSTIYRTSEWYSITFMLSMAPAPS